jgi:hypothetical protein
MKTLNLQDEREQKIFASTLKRMELTEYYDGLNSSEKVRAKKFIENSPEYSGESMALAIQEIKEALAKSEFCDSLLKLINWLERIFIRIFGE